VCPLPRRQYVRHRLALPDWGSRPTSTYFKAVNLVAQKLARLMIESSNCLFSQHLPGNTNGVSDLLSYEGSARSNEKDAAEHPLALDCPPGADLTQRFHTFLPQLIPEDFAISLLPSEIASFTTLATPSDSRIVLDAVQEGSHKTRDQTWRRWSCFCDEMGVIDPLLVDLSSDKQELILRVFLVCLLVSDLTVA
jgi:hypothetical protein